MKQRVLGLLIFLSLFGSQLGSVQAQQPTVYAVLFYSPSCGHCHYVITEVLPPLQEQYGDQLKILYIDVSQPDGNTLFHAAFDALSLPEDRRGYVPMMVIGTKVWVGSGDIPEQMPEVVREGLASGGIDLPLIPGLRETYEAAVGTEQGGDPQDPASETASISTVYREITWQDRLKQDEVGNGFALAVLALLVVGLSVQVGNAVRLFNVSERRQWAIGRGQRLFMVVVAAMTTFIAGTLVFEGGGISLPSVLAAGVALGMVFVTVTIARAKVHARHGGFSLPDWLLPVIAVLGLVVAGYLTYVEVGENEAVCGAVGDCNTVQQSDYATLFGMIPIGVLGLAGYLLILAAWSLRYFGGGKTADLSQALLLGMALFGVGFSIYLTFLEPFVIGATCAWCLTSALLMILILAVEAPAGWRAFNRLTDRQARRSYRHRRSER